ncbi:hypothetical protein SHAQ108633_15570 [Shewanella aquimarina]
MPVNQGCCQMEFHCKGLAGRRPVWKYQWRDYLVCDAAYITLTFLMFLWVRCDGATVSALGI